MGSSSVGAEAGGPAGWATRSRRSSGSAADPGRPSRESGGVPVTERRTNLHSAGRVRGSVSSSKRIALPRPAISRPWRRAAAWRLRQPCSPQFAGICGVRRVRTSACALPRFGARIQAPASGDLLSRSAAARPRYFSGFALSLRCMRFSVLPPLLLAWLPA